MAKIPTAEEMEMSGNYDSYQDMMIAFAKMHVEAALKAATKKGQLDIKHEEEDGYWQTDHYTYGDNDIKINKESIISSYPLNKIK